MIGGMGSGKTTLAAKLAQRLSLPLYNLDDVAMQSGLDRHFRPLCPIEKRLADVHVIAAAPAWVTEGSFLWWTRELLVTSDLIVWLDVSPRSALTRVIVRQVREYVYDIRHARGLGQRLHAVRHPHIMHLVRFIGLTRNYHRRAAETVNDVDDAYALSRMATVAELAAYSTKVVRCSTRSGTDALLRNLESRAGTGWRQPAWEANYDYEPIRESAQG